MTTCLLSNTSVMEILNTVCAFLQYRHLRTIVLGMYFFFWKSFKSNESDWLHPAPVGCSIISPMHISCLIDQFYSVQSPWLGKALITFLSCILYKASWRNEWGQQEVRFQFSPNLIYLYPATKARSILSKTARESYISFTFLNMSR